jgi:methionyl-tRNA formyltransferase
MYLAGEEKGSAKIFHATFTAKEHSEVAGTIRTDGKGSLEVACTNGWVAIHELQVAGKRRMATRDLLLGFRNIEDYTM